MRVEVRIATPAETRVVSEILAEAIAWLDESGVPMWRLNEAGVDQVAADVEAGTFAVAWCGASEAGVIKFQLEDPVFWPEVPPGTSAYVHRLAIRRRFAGGVVSSALLSWAVEEARRHGRQMLRLDCEASRSRLRAVYERFGFRYHSDRRVGPYVVARYEYPLDSSEG